MAEAAGGPGLVSLVGAGPGDPGLLTVRGRRALERADVVLYDHLASPALLASVDVPGQERIHVGKTAGAGRSRQEDINALLVRRARAGARVVRLKGGDPSVFGRGGEEADACAAAGVPFEIVPGVSALTAVTAYAGIPLTHRDASSLFLAATGHERGDGEGDDADGRVDWEALGRVGGTVVIFMGILQVARWSAALVAGGRAPETPVALIRWGTTPRQETLVATLGTVAARVAAEGFRPPALAVVGEVVALRERLAWVERRPLFGQVVGVTRSAGSDLDTFEPLEDLGAQVIHLPLTLQRPVGDDAPLAEALAAGGYTDLVLTSANGVDATARALARAGLDARDLAGVTTWAVGPATAAAMRARLGLRADRVPDEATGEGLVERAAAVGVAGRRVLFPAAAEARPVVPRGLEALGAEVIQVAAYETLPDPRAPARLESALEQGLSLLTVASPSAVRALVDALAAVGHGPDAVPVAAIGPTTAAAARRLQCDVAVVAETHTMAGLAEAIARHVAAGAPRAPRPPAAPGDATPE